MEQIQALTQQIKTYAGYDNIKVFEDIDLTIYNYSEFIVK